ncbi:hypothetical protein PFISCL1PPCAC_22631 [Pristionchus fissidentatus]|uniref:G-protein coupled receptors family 1 profile domain-containing protein n=1 Tax=Pristionchus fissidentatus TaxID=1538716 RepID=A0AAV5WKS1_9BILA|nr:hypothetical protein PFISCL1PPCAC_22631 [Pristionchus fissidentatus]
MSKGSPDVCQFLSNNSQVFPVFSPPADDVSKINDIVYGVISPVIIIFGIVGDVLTVYTLTHPLLRKSSIVYMYLTLLAMTDLLTQMSVIPMILFLQGRVVCSAAAAFYYAHIGFPLANALMGSSVYIIIFLTLSQYMAVCRPFAYGMRSRKICYILFAVAYFCNFCLNAPWALKKTYYEIPPAYRTALQLSCPYVICDDVTPPTWYKPYEAVREACCRILPFFVLVFLNANILITYRNTKLDRMKRLTTSQKRFVTEKSEKEEKRLFTLLFAICIVFFVCTIPAAPLAIFVSDTLSKNLQFQIFRAVVNLLEFTKFALNFYFYCLINPEIRSICWDVITCKKLHRPARVKGQPMTPISMYTRSTKSRDVALNGGSGATGGTAESRRSSTNQDGRSNSSLKKNGMRDRANTVVQADVLAEKLTVIRESETDDVGEKI